MSTDLKTVTDRPQNLIRAKIDERNADPVASIDVVFGIRTGGLQDAEVLLNRYEHAHDVTFAALDNTALENLRQAYASGTSGEVAAAVADLLGLDD